MKLKRVKIIGDRFTAASGALIHIDNEDPMAVQQHILHMASSNTSFGLEVDHISYFKKAKLMNVTFRHLEPVHHVEWWYVKLEHNFEKNL